VQSWRLRALGKARHPAARTYAFAAVTDDETPQLVIVDARKAE
jgi:hypothetical protein